MSTDTSTQVNLSPPAPGQATGIVATELCGMACPEDRAVTCTEPKGHPQGLRSMHIGGRWWWDDNGSYGFDGSKPQAATEATVGATGLPGVAGCPSGVEGVFQRIDLSYQDAVAMLARAVDNGDALVMCRASLPHQRLRVQACGRIESACPCGCTYVPDVDGVMATDWVVGR